MDNKKQFNFTKTRLCNVWLYKGCCQRMNCDFAHGIEELNETAIENQLDEEKQCIFYTNKGFCKKGDDCNYLHSDPHPLQKKLHFIPMVSDVNENFEEGPSSATLSSRTRRALEFKGTEDETKRMITKLVKEQLAKMGKKSKLHKIDEYEAPLPSDSDTFSEM